MALGNPPHPSRMWGSGSVGAPWLDFCDAHTAQGHGPSLAGPHAEARDLKRGPGRPPHATGHVKDREDAGPVAEHVLYACRWVVTAHEEGRGFHPTVVRRLWKARSTCILVFGHTQGRSIYAGPPGPCGSRASQSRNTKSARPLMDPSSACGAGGCAHTGLQLRPPKTDSRPPVTKPRTNHIPISRAQ